jgi:hypothetical protein
MEKYDKENYEFKKPSGMIQSRVFKNENDIDKHYGLSPIQFDTLNLMMYRIKESLLTEFKTTANIINLITSNYEGFEKIIDTTWYEMSFSELFNFLGTESSKNHRYIDIDLKALTKVSISTNIFDKNKNVGQTTFNMLRKYTRFKNKIKFKVEPELFQMVMFQSPNTNETYAKMKLIVQARFLNTVGSKRLYEFAKDWEFKKSIIITVDDLKTIMNLNVETPSNSTFALINRNHLKRAIIEINDNSDLKLSYEPIKERLPGQRLQVTKIKFNIETQPESRLQELGLIQPTIIENKYYNKSKFKLDKLVKNGYKVIDEEKWVETDIKNNQKRYDDETRIDTWMKETSHDDKNSIFESLASYLDDCNDPIVYIDDYKIVGVFSKEIFSKNPTETITLMNEVLTAMAENENEK